MKYKTALAALFTAESIPLFNDLESTLVSVGVARDLVKAGLINLAASACYEPEHPVKTAQVFDEASSAELINTNTPLRFLVKFVVGDYWIFFDPIDCQRVATLNTRSMKLWV